MIWQLAITSRQFYGYTWWWNSVKTCLAPVLIIGGKPKSLASYANSVWFFFLLTEVFLHWFWLSRLERSIIYNCGCGPPISISLPVSQLKRLICHLNVTENQRAFNPLCKNKVAEIHFTSNKSNMCQEKFLIDNVNPMLANFSQSLSPRPFFSFFLGRILNSRVPLPATGSCGNAVSPEF